MNPVVDITFDCVPLRSVGRFDVPLDASTAYRARCERVATAIKKHGVERTYLLENTRCVFRLANSNMVGMLRFEFGGFLVTDAGDAKAAEVDLDIRLTAETCGGVPADVETWLHRIVRDAVMVEFDRYIASGNRDADVTKLESATDASPTDPYAGGDL